MHIRRHILERFQAGLTGIPGVAVDPAIDLVRVGAFPTGARLPALFVFAGKESIAPVTQNAALRITRRTLEVYVVLLVSREGYRDGTADEIALEVERRVFKSGAVKGLPIKQLSLIRTDTDFEGSQAAIAMVFEAEFHAGEGEPSISGV